MNKKFIKSMKGFTLIEVLIASAIFAMALIFTTATISQGGSFYSKLKAQRESSEDTRKIADLLTKDIRAANQEFSYIFDPETGVATDYKYGIAILSCRSLCTKDYNPSRPSVATSNEFEGKGNVLVAGIKKEDSTVLYKVYFSKYTQYTPSFSEAIGIYSKSFTVLPSLDEIAAVPNDENNLISSDANDSSLDLAGAAPGWDNKVQPFVKFRIEAKTKNYNSLAAAQRADNIIESMATTRNYEK